MSARTVKRVIHQQNSAHPKTHPTECDGVQPNVSNNQVIWVNSVFELRGADTLILLHCDQNWSSATIITVHCDVFLCYHPSPTEKKLPCPFRSFINSFYWPSHCWNIHTAPAKPLIAVIFACRIDIPLGSIHAWLPFDHIPWISKVL